MPVYDCLAYSNVSWRSCAHDASCVLSTRRPHPEVAMIDGAPAPAAQLALFDDAAATLPTRAAPSMDATPSRASRHPWAFLLQHTFAVDVLCCASCQGRMRLIEVATTATAVARVLA